MKFDLKHFWNLAGDINRYTFFSPTFTFMVSWWWIQLQPLPNGIKLTAGFIPPPSGQGRTRSRTVASPPRNDPPLEPFVRCVVCEIVLSLKRQNMFTQKVGFSCLGILKHDTSLTLLAHNVPTIKLVIESMQTSGCNLRNKAFVKSSRSYFLN